MDPSKLYSASFCWTLIFRRTMLICKKNFSLIYNKERLLLIRTFMHCEKTKGFNAIKNFYMLSSLYSATCGWTIILMRTMLICRKNVSTIYHKERLLLIRTIMHMAKKRIHCDKIFLHGFQFIFCQFWLNGYLQENIVYSQKKF